MRGHFQQPANFLKCVAMPDFQYDDFALFHWKLRQAFNSLPFQRTFLGTFLKPPMRFQFSREPSPERPPVIERTIAKTSDEIVLRLFRWLIPLHQRNERFLQDILGFRVPKSERPAIENQLRRFRVV